MFKEFRDFVLQGKSVDLAVGVVVGASFGVLINSLVSNLLTPLISIFGKTNFAGWHFSVQKSVFQYGLFLNDLVSFLLIAVAVFFLVIRPLNKLMHRRWPATQEMTTRQCSECLSEVPVQARRCAFCTSELTPSLEE